MEKGKDHHQKHRSDLHTSAYKSGCAVWHKCLLQRFFFVSGIDGGLNEFLNGDTMEDEKMAKKFVKNHEQDYSGKNPVGEQITAYDCSNPMETKVNYRCVKKRMTRILINLPSVCTMCNCLTLEMCCKYITYSIFAYCSYSRLALLTLKTLENVLDSRMKKFGKKSLSK